MSKEKEFNLEDYIEKEETTELVEYKEPEYVVLPSCLQKAIGIKGPLLGHLNMIFGLSDSNKTKTMIHTAKAAQQQGILPILVLTENKFNKSRAEAIGLDPKKCIIKEDLTTLEDVYDYISVKINDVKKGKLNTNVMIFWDSVTSTPSKDSFEFDAEGKIKKKYTFDEIRKRAGWSDYYG